MFSNSIAELMIAKNDEMEKDVMPNSLSEPLLDSLQNVVTRADHDKTRYSFSEHEKNKNKKRSQVDDWGRSPPSKAKKRK